MYEEQFMARALSLSAQALDTPGTEPFGAVVVQDGRIVGEGFNHSVANFDPTSHGEIEAIRDACKRLARVELTGCDLYTSCEPCALCLAAMHIVGIRRLFYAASLEQSDAAIGALPPKERHPIDVAALRVAAATPVGGGALPAQQHGADEAVRILRTWAQARG